MFEPDLKLREKCFREMGWHYDPSAVRGPMLMGYQAKGVWFDRGSNRIGDLPPIEISWGVCAEFLIPFMFGKDAFYYIKREAKDASAKVLDWRLIFIWKVPVKNNEGDLAGFVYGEAEIYNHNIPNAACKAFLAVEL